MASTSNDLSASCSSCSALSPPSWDVFLSFYGKDTRSNFTSHLYSALVQEGILTFQDDPELQKGQGISMGLLKAINETKMFVVVISENYARSHWCLDELVEILKCNKTKNQVVPVFYYVDPSQLRHQVGSFGEALDHHRKHYSVEMIDKWKSALAEIAELSGYHLKKDANVNESDTVKQIVETVALQVSTKVLDLDQYLFGIDSAVEDIRERLSMESNVVRAIGICGMGGIGKTTIAKTFYNKYYNKFDISCFVENVKQYSQGASSPCPLLEQLLISLLRRKDYKVRDVESGIRQLKQVLFSRKALIVLDDFDQSCYSQFLVRLCNLFYSGSRIMITTRDTNLPNQLKLSMSEVDIYMVKELGETDSLELFCYHAFGKSMPPESFRELSRSFVTFAGGLPLALKVLGSSLRNRTQVSFWKAKLQLVREIPENNIQKILKLSYDDLAEETIKEVFLDIAFFFVGKDKDEAVDIFKSCNFHPEVAIPILEEKCLLTIDKYKRFQMHNLIQDMGTNLGKSTRLFWRGNEWEDLRNQEGVDKIEGLILDLTCSTKKQISSQIFERMFKLRLLEIFDADGIKGRFKNSFQELRCIYWNYCPWTQLPSSFRPQNLISLHMLYSNFTILWKGALPLLKLKTIDVTCSVNLKTTPDFRNSKLVERLYFHGCENLLNVHPSIRELTSLYILDLGECDHLKELAEPIGQSSMLGHWYLYPSVEQLSEPIKQLTNLCYLWLGHCSNLRRLPNQLGDMKSLLFLDASHTAIEELPDSITQLKELVYLKLEGCKMFRKLPDQIGNIKSLTTFSAGESAVEQLPDSFVDLVNLVILDLTGCRSLTNLPNDIWKLKLLQELILESCSKIKQLPEELGKMQCLKYINASDTSITILPDSVGLLSRLQVLSLCNCKKLRYLPNSIWNLTSLAGLGLLQHNSGRLNLPNTVNNTKLESLSLDCNTRLWLPMILSFSSLKELVVHDVGQSFSSTKPFSLAGLSKLQSLAWDNYLSPGSSFPELPPNLTALSLYNHYTLVQLPDLSSLEQLKKLDIVRYPSLKSLPPLPPHLQSLKIYDCIRLQDLSDMSMLKELVSLSFGSSSNLKLLSLKQSFLQVRRHSLSLDVPKIAEWFSYKSNGRTLSFKIPPILEENFLGVGLWVLFTCKKDNSSHCFTIAVVVTNKTEHKTYPFWIPVTCREGTEVHSVVSCLSGGADKFSVKSGDRIKISFKRQLYDFWGGREVPYEEVKVEMCAAHVIQKTATTPCFTSVLNNFLR